MKILVISAHPDDLEIACGGTLRRLQLEGADITSVVLIKPSAEDHVNRDQHTVTQELKHSYDISGFGLKVFDTDLHANGRPNLICNNVTMSKLASLLEPCDVAIIHNPEDSHQDHRTAYELSWPLVKTLAQETWLMTSWPYCLTYTTCQANLFYDISNHWLFKQSLLQCYGSYLTDEKIHMIKTANAYFGQRNRQPLAESFTIVNKHV